MSDKVMTKRLGPRKNNKMANANVRTSRSSLESIDYSQVQKNRIIGLSTLKRDNPMNTTFFDKTEQNIELPRERNKNYLQLDHTSINF